MQQPTSSAPSSPLRWVYRRRATFPLATDCLAWVIAVAGVSVLQSGFGPSGFGMLMLLTSVAIAFQIAAGLMLGSYRSRWRVASFEEVSAVGMIWAIAAAAYVVGSLIAAGAPVDLPRPAVVIAATAALLIMLVSRFVWRFTWEQARRPVATNCRPTVVLGAGEGGVQAVKAMLSDPDSNYYPVAVLDDDPGLAGRRIGGVPVLGTRNDLVDVATAHSAEVLLLAIPSATSDLVQESASLAKQSGLDLRVLPPVSEIVDKMTVADVRPPTVDDLLGRDPVEIDVAAVADYIKGRRVLITGAGGSIGSELSQQVARFEPSELYLLDRDESALHGLQLQMEGRALLDTDQLVVADIRDRERIFEIFEQYRPEVVFHTAALKHLTLLERHPEEGVKTNVLGTKNLLDGAASVDVARFVNISTDKAADPTSVLGATKLAAERLTAAAAAELGRPYLSVRFGNVLGSRGSVLPTFLAQLERGEPLTVTDAEATRFFMTIPEAVRLVVQAGAIGEPGEVLILDMGEPVKILDLAEQLIDLLAPTATIEVTGLRPGEKLHEQLIASAEIGQARVHPRIIHTVAEPAQAWQAIVPAVLDGIGQKLTMSSISVG